MSAYAFIGSQVELMNPPMTCSVFGQTVEIPDELAHEAVLQGAQFLPEATFTGLGFTPEELQKYSSYLTHDTADAAFKEKKQAALIALHEYRDSLKAPVQATT